MEEILNQIETYVTKFGLQIVGAIAILIIGIWLSGILAKITKKIMTKNEVDQTLSKFVTSLVKTALITFVVIAAIDNIGVETASFIAVLGAAGLAIGFALQGSLSNFASGVMLIIFRPVRVGDYIEGAGISGSVDNIGMFVTVLTTPDNKIIYIPNSKLASDNIVNYSQKDTRRVDMVFGISYTDDIDKARTVIKSILENDTRVLKEPEPMIVIGELADSSVNFYVRPWAKTGDYWGLKFDVTEQVKKRFDQEGISIPFPQQDVHLIQSGN